MVTVSKDGPCPLVEHASLGDHCDFVFVSSKQYSVLRLKKKVGGIDAKEQPAFNLDGQPFGGAGHSRFEDKLRSSVNHS